MVVRCRFTLLWVCCSVYCSGCAVSRVLYRAWVKHVYSSTHIHGAFPPLSDGSVNYRLWTGGDSISDLGRLIDLYMKAVRNCRDSSWAQRYLPAVEAIGEQLLALRRAAAKGPDPGVCCRGLLQGAPEHDFSGDTTHFYFNNNVWTLRGMVQLGTYLSGGVSPDKGAPPVNASLGAALLQEAKLFAPQLAAAVAASTVNHPPPTTMATATVTSTATTAAAQAKTGGR